MSATETPIMAALEAPVDENHFDYIIVGTGLRESILAAALARQGSSVLQVDERPYYGAEQASLSLVELDDWSRSVDRTRYSNVELKYRDGDAWSTSLPQHLRASSRKYSLSLCPVLVPAVCPFVRTLIASGVAKYTNFNLLEGVAMYSDGTFQPAALSKADIFNDKELSLIDKRKLMKFLAFATGDYSRSPLMEADGRLPLSDFLAKHFGLQNKLKDNIIYAASLETSQSGDAIHALGRLQKYMKSTGRFGTSPFLLPEYGGMGELTQGFCRACAVHGGVNMLGRRLSDMQDASCQASASITADGQDTFTANCLVRSVPARDSSRCYSRGLVLLDKRLPLPVRSLLSATPDIYDGEKTQDHDTVRLAEHALFILPPGSMDTHLPACPVFGLMVGPNTFGTPEGQYALYLYSITPTTHQTAQSVLQPCLNALLEYNNDIAEPAQPLLTLFYNEVAPGRLVYTGSGATTEQEDAPFEQASAGLAEICDDAAEEALRVFSQLTGERELFETADASVEPDEE